MKDFAYLISFVGGIGFLLFGFVHVKKCYICYVNLGRQAGKVFGLKDFLFTNGFFVILYVASIFYCMAKMLDSLLYFWVRLQF